MFADALINNGIAVTSRNFLNNNNVVTSIKSGNSSFTTNMVTTSSVVNVYNGTVASTLASHYQVITICNTLPSILKCQNRQHFLILHRVIYGLSNTSSVHGPSSCVPQTTCLLIDEADQFNCTGSNICVFYPIDRTLSTCNNVESNLTQIHITCVSLVHFKRYYSQLNKKFEIIYQNKSNEIFNQSNTVENWVTTLSKGTDIKINSTTTITNSPVLVSEFSFLERNSIIVIVLTVISSLIAVFLFLVAYYKIRMRQINNMRNPTPTNSTETTNSTSLNKQMSNDTDKILNTKTSLNNNHLSSINLLKNRKNNFSYGLNNKLVKLRMFFVNLVQKDNDDQNTFEHTTNKIHNNLNGGDPLKQYPQSKCYSIALNLMQYDPSIYENSLCKCGNKTDKLCMNCLKQNQIQNLIDDESEFEKEILANATKALPPSPSQVNSNYSMIRKPLDVDTTIPLDILNSTSLIPSSISLIQNANYVLYDIPEVDETIENDSDMVEYYYNHTEKI